MKKHILISSLPILILILILILIPIRANAQETLWEANGVPIRQFILNGSELFAPVIMDQPYLSGQIPAMGLGMFLPKK